MSALSPEALQHRDQLLWRAGSGEYDVAGAAIVLLVNALRRQRQRG